MRKDLSVRGKGCNCCGGNGIPQLLSDATGVDWIRCCLVVHVAAIAEVWSRKRNRMGRFFMQSDLQENILRMGEYMRPAFTERERSGIDVRAYAKKLTDRAEIHVAVNEKDEIVGMIAAYLNRKDYGLL